MKNYDKRLINDLPKELSLLLSQELASGNEIVEVAGGWPMKKANVWLKYKFRTDYRKKYPNLKYKETNDPHYWRDEYLDVDNQAMIATKY